MLFVLIGVIGGTLGAMGLGGGSVLIPLLSLLSISQKSAQVANIFSFIIMSIFLLPINISKKKVDFFPSAIFGIAGCLFSFLSALLVKNLDENLSKYLFGSFLIAVGICEIIKFLSKYAKNKR